MQQSLCNTLDIVEMDLGQPGTEPLTVYIPVQDTHLSRRWLDSLDQILQQGLHLEKNYCFLGLAQGARSGEYITDRINQSCEAINRAQIGYEIPQHFYVSNCILPGAVTGRDGEGGDVNHARMNQLHRYFEDLQGINGAMSPYYDRADSTTRWHIRQLNLLCHEFESWALSWRKLITAPEWQRPSQLMCWLRAPRFELEPEDFDLFGVDTLTRPTGGVYVGINKAIGKGHWEVFVDEAGYDPDHRCDTLTTSSLRPQTLAAGDFDIEWAKSPAGQDWWSRRLVAFRT